MNNKVNYTLVGLFVLIGLVLMFGFAYWMLKPTTQEEMKKYRIYFKESVFGLNINAPVKYRGISVGKVIGLRINPKNSEEVEVTVDILKSTPIKENTVAKLTAQGITGLTYINLTQGANRAPALQRKNGEEYPVIQTAPSFFEHFERSLGDVSTELIKTLYQAQKLLNDKNEKKFEELLEDTSHVMHKFDTVLDNKTIEHFHASMKNLDVATKQINTIIPNINKLVAGSLKWENNINDSFNSIKATYTDMGKTMDGMAKTFSKAQHGFDKMSHNVNNTMLDTQNLMMNLEGTLDDFKRNPSAIIYKKTEQKTAPGER